MIVAPPPKTGRRGDEKPAGRVALEQPHRAQHERSVEQRARQPMRLRDYLRELKDAWESETMAVARLHVGGVEWEAKPRDGETGDYGGSKLGTPRWTPAFRAYVTGNDCDTTQDGEWRWPLRSSVFRLSVSRSGTDRLAAAFVYLLIHNRFHVREAWAQQCGMLADPDIADAAEAWALTALYRWWSRYVEQPSGRPLA